MFTVRQHGTTPMNDLAPVVALASAKVATQVAATRTSGAGRYAVRFVAPVEGDWTITVKTGFGPSEVTLHPIPAVGDVRLASASGAHPHALERAHDPIDRGRRLFVAKGCVTCHVHADAGRPTLAPLAPDLTHKRFDAAYLRLYLANPAIRPPTRRDGFAMPNLGLKSAEIIPLVAFLDAETRAGTQQGRR
jgi:hypothetical protein